jgi:hypothetical protein
VATVNLPPDFKEVLQLLSAHHAEYLLISGYAVAYYGYPWATADMDIWFALHPKNAEKVVTALRAFGTDLPELSPALFLKEGQIIRMGVPPLSEQAMHGQQSCSRQIMSSWRPKLVC